MISVDKRIIHGHSNHPLYSVWSAMIRRCTSPSSADYPDYGGRGIKIALKWYDIKQFIKDMGNCPDGLMLERIDNNGDYCKKNCKWASPQEQARNRRSNRLLTIKGITKHASDWAKEYNILQCIINARINAGWDVEAAITTPSYKKRKFKYHLKPKRFGIYKMNDNGETQLLNFTVAFTPEIAWRHFHQNKAEAVKNGVFISVVK